MVSVNLKAILTGIAGTTDDDVAYGFHGVKGQLIAWKLQNILHNADRFRSLDGQLPVVFTAIPQRYVETIGMFLHPCPVLIDVCRVDNYEKLGLIHFIDQQIVHRATMLIEHHAIKNFAFRGVGHVIGEDMVHPSLGVRPLYGHLPHVTHVEYAAVLAHGLVLLNDGGVLDGHVESAERSEERRVGKESRSRWSPYH